MEKILKEHNPKLYQEYKQQQYLHNYEKMKEWRANNKDLFNNIKKKYKQKPFICECGKTITTGNKSYHLKSSLHSKLLKKKQLSEPPKETKEEELRRLSIEFDKLLGL